MPPHCDSAKIRKPVVYVGHSIAALYGVLLQGTYRDDVAAEVLVDPSFADQIEADLASLPPEQEVENAHANFGNKPLVILTRVQNAASWNVGHDKLAALSQNGSNTLVPNSSHYIQVDQPKTVIDAVIKAVQDVRH